MANRSERRAAQREQPNEPSSTVTISGGTLTNEQLRASAVPVSGPLTNAQLRADAVHEIDQGHQKIHAGLMFSFCDEVAGLVNTAAVDYLIVTGAKAPHLIWEAFGDTAMRLQFYEASTTSANGAAQSVRNRNRGSASVPVTAIYKTPTITVVGDLLCQERDGSASTSSKVGGEVREGHEWILKVNTKYLIRVTSLSGASASLNFAIKFNFYEPA